jgi:ribosomal protein S18 acetylase RimI-like enzyme
MNAPVTLRPARPADAPGIARVHVETWRNAYAGLVPEAYLVGMTEARQTALWSAVIGRAGGREAPREEVLVAETDGGRAAARIVGFGSCGPSRDPAFAGEIYTLYVAGDWQGRGVGRALLGGLFERLRRARLKDAVIWVLSGNPSRFFYEAMGGRRVAERREAFAGTQLETTAYAWSDLAVWPPSRRGTAR